MATNLFICLTPLQTLIAQTLIKQHSSDENDLLFSCLQQYNNPKSHYYFEQTAPLCRHANQVLIPQNYWMRAFNLPKLIRPLQSQYDTVFLASIDSIHMHYILSHISFKHLETFDDGVANIIRSGIYYQDTPNDLPRRLLNCIYGIRYTAEIIRTQTRLHHTLFPNLPNISKHISHVRLWQSETQHISTRHCLKLFLGQPIFNQATQNRQFVEKILQTFHIDHYFPHPREIERPSGVSVIHTPLIFEDWLRNHLQEHPDTEIEIYHFFSTAALNVLSFSRVQIISIQTDHPRFQQPDIQELYTLMHHMDITIIPYSIPQTT